MTNLLLASVFLVSVFFEIGLAVFLEVGFSSIAHFCFNSLPVRWLLPCAEATEVKKILRKSFMIMIAAVVVVVVVVDLFLSFLSCSN